MSKQVPEDELDNHDHENKDICDNYNCDIKTYIEWIYIISAILWIILTVVLGLWSHDDIIVWIILLLPLVVFAINYLSLGEFSCKMEDQMFRGNFLSFGFLVAIILINWNSPMGHHDKVEFFKILIAAFILLMISLIDLWVGHKKMAIVKHIKTSLHTASLTLLAVGLYLYYTYQRDHYRF